MKLVILSRDGVINLRAKDELRSLDDWQPLPGSLQALGRLSQAGFKLVIATNQPDLASGKLDLETLDAIHSKLGRELEQYGGYIDAVFFCPHAPEDNCDCHKPADGLFREIARRYQRDLQQVPVIGDSIEDIQAAQSVGAQPVLVKTGKGEQTFSDHAEQLANALVFNNLSEAAEAILAE